MRNGKNFLTCTRKLMYGTMRRFLSLIALLLLTCGSLCADSFVLGKLKQIPQISDIQELKVDPFNEYYQFCFEQPIDHADPGKGTFKQRVLLGHRAADAPVVVELEGYFLFSKDAGELSTLFEGNQLTIEHRFFDESVPSFKVPASFYFFDLVPVQIGPDMTDARLSYEFEFLRHPVEFPSVQMGADAVGRADGRGGFRRDR